VEELERLRRTGKISEKEYRKRKRELEKVPEEEPPITRPEELVKPRKKSLPIIRTDSKPILRLVDLSTKTKFPSIHKRRIKFPYLITEAKPTLSVSSLVSTISFPKVAKSRLSLPRYGLLPKRQVKISDLDLDFKPRPMTKARLIRLPQVEISTRPCIAIQELVTFQKLPEPSVREIELPMFRPSEAPSVKPSVKPEIVLEAKLLSPEDEDLEKKLEEVNIEFFEFETVAGKGKIEDEGAILIVTKPSEKKHKCLDAIQDLCVRILRERGERIQDVRVMTKFEEMREYHPIDYHLFVIREMEKKIDSLRKQMEAKRQEGI